MPKIYQNKMVPKIWAATEAVIICTPVTNSPVVSADLLESEQLTESSRQQMAAVKGD
jgi:hypothetical protein